MVGVFFSGTVQSSGGKAIRDREANKGKEDREMLEASDIIVCCCKFLAGWDEWAQADLEQSESGYAARVSQART